jgi:hypothetical protein
VRLPNQFSVPTAHIRQHQQGFLSQRTWAVLAVLIALLLIPFWWSKRVNDKTQREQAIAAAKPTAQQASNTPADTTINAPINNPDRFGLSFGYGTPNSTPTATPLTGMMYSACAGGPLDMGNPDKGQCNPYQGDSSCRTALPVLCILKDGSTPESAGLTKDPQAEGSTTGFDFYAGWAGGSLGATAPVAGFVLGSLANANARCAAELGAGWRMAEFHDAGGGWGLVGKRGPGWLSGQASQPTRHWVYINDQKANCWDADGK